MAQQKASNAEVSEITLEIGAWPNLKMTFWFNYIFCKLIFKIFTNNTIFIHFSYKIKCQCDKCWQNIENGLETYCDDYGSIANLLCPNTIWTKGIEENNATKNVGKTENSLEKELGRISKVQHLAGNCLAAQMNHWILT